MKTYLLPAELRDACLEVIDFHEPASMSSELNQLRRLPEAKLLDLSKVRRWEMFWSREELGAGMRYADEGMYVRYSDLTAAVQPDLSGLVEALEHISMICMTKSSDEVYEIATAALSAYRGE